jgi:hypothetical protein
VDLESKTRSELDEIAVDLELDPSEYSTKAELIAAIQAEQEDDEEEDVEVDDQSEDPEATQLPAGDVDIADVPEKKYAGESPPLILAGYWARLNDDDSVPEEYIGHLVAILESPWTSSPYANDEQASAIKGYRYDKDKLFLVRTRDTADALLEVPFAAFAVTGQSRSDVEGHG